MTLIVAAGGGQLELVQVLLRCGADARLREPDGTRALDWAAQEGHREVVDVLLAHDRGLLDLPGLRDRTPLMAAAGNGHVDLVGVLLERGADPRRRMDRGARALDWAADEGHEAVVELLLTHDPGLLDLPGFGGCTALMAAAARGHVELSRMLLARGADPALREAEGTRALDWAAQNGHLDVVECLLAHRPELLDMPGLDERTALMAAAARGHVELLRRLLARGADPSLRKKEGTRALDWAAQEGHQEVVSVLLAQQPELLDAPGHGGRTALMAAAANGRVRLTLRLLECGADPRQRKEEGTRALDWAAQNGHQAVVEHLLSRDPELLNLPGYGERTALIAAASNGHVELMRRLLERGADARTRESSGTRALDWTSQEGHVAAVKLLLAHEPEVLDLPGYGERTALIAAAGNGHTEVVRVLLARQADTRARRASGAHALDSAAQEGHQEIVDLLLAHDPGLLDLPGAGERTALMAAASGNRIELVQQLLSRGADPRRRESEGTHALDWAAQNGHAAVVELLLAHDRELLELPGFGDRTALIAAAGNGHLDLVEGLLGRGSDVRRRRASGAHALDAAAQDGHAAVVERLLAHDPQLLDLPGAGGRTALMAAAANNREEVVRALLARGADPHLRESEGTRALDWACQRGFQATAELLLAHDPGLLDLPGYGERTALIAAACNGHAPLVGWLLVQGADPRRRESEGTHALDWAAQEGHQAVVDLLLGHDPGLLDLPGYGERTALIAAADNGHAELVALLLARGADVHRRRASGAHALDSAAQGGHAAVVELLLAHDPGLLDLPGREERSALIAAAGAGHVPLVRSLLGRGADPRLRESDGTRALDWAAQKGLLAVVEQLLEHDPGLLDLPGYGDRTALIAAAAHSHVELVRWLLDRGADPRLRTPEGGSALDCAAQSGDLPLADALLTHDPGLLELPGYHERTALIAAASNAHAELVGVLLSRGADPRKRETSGTRALDWAAQKGYQEVVQRLVEHDPALLDLPGYDERTALMAAAANNHVELARWLLERGADPRLRESEGARALDWASQNGHQGAVECLLDADPGLLDLPGYGERTALMAAASNGHSQLVWWLLSRGADPRVREPEGTHAFDWAAQNGHELAVVHLLEEDPDLLDLPGYHERTALSAAASNGHDSLVRRLLALGADPRRRRTGGAHALDLAAESGHQAVVESLLAHDPSLLELPGYGERTALSAAAGTGHVDVVRELLVRGADPRRRRAEGANALYWAARHGHQAVLDLLLELDPGLLELPVIAASGPVGPVDLRRALAADHSQAGTRMPSGASLIEVLILARRPELAQDLLRRHERLINTTGIGGATPLMLSAATAQAGLTSWLLAQGADPAARDEAGDHALLHALERHAAECARILMDHEPRLLHLAGRGGRVAALLLAQTPVEEPRVSQVADDAVTPPG
jgi:ankyrin repeat protein